MTLVEKVARELCRWDGFGLEEPMPHIIAILMAKRIIKMVRSTKGKKRRSHADSK